MKHWVLNRRWAQGSPEIRERLSEILRVWNKTPYMAGCQAPRMGVDCVRFVAAVLDSMLGIHTNIRALPQDIAFHKPDTAQAALHCLLRAYSPVRALEDGEPLLPADVIIVGPPSGGPGHSILVGPEPCTLWQSDVGTGVAQGGFSLVEPHQRLKRIYRVRKIQEPWLP